MEQPENILTRVRRAADDLQAARLVVDAKIKIRDELLIEALDQGLPRWRVQRAALLHNGGMQKAILRAG